MKPVTLLFFATLILFLVVLFYNYWKLQLSFNTSSVSNFTPTNLFPLDGRYEKEYHAKIALGNREAKKTRAVICCMFRDTRTKLDTIKIRAERMGDLFQDYRILAVENDSKDDTRAILLDWSRKNPKVEVLGCGVGLEECTLNLKATDGHSVDRTRIEKMVVLRRIYLDRIKEAYRTWDYAVVWDLDAIGSVYHDGVWNTLGWFSQKEQIDGICAYGLHNWFGPFFWYYDTYAHIDYGDDFHIDKKVFHDIKKGLSVRYPRGHPLVDVVSCFSGFTIYRIGGLLKKRAEYSMPSKDNIECEHYLFHSPKDGREALKIALNPSMVNLLLLND